MTAIRAASMFVWIAVALLAVNSIRLFTASRLSAPAALLQPVPYTIVADERLFDGRESRPGGHYVLAVRTDGSHVTWLESVKGTFPTRTASQRLIRFSDGRRVETDELRHYKSSMKSEFSLLNSRDPKNSCLLDKDALVGHTKLLGFETVEIHTASKAIWLAPALGCAELKMRRVWGEAYAEREATEVYQGQPDPQLFGFDGYTEVRPSVLFRRSPTDPAIAAVESKYIDHRISGS